MKNLARDMANNNNINNRIHNIACRVTSVDADGKYMNAESYRGGEMREMTIMLPFGISSSAIDGVSVQVSLNSANSGTIVGVNDPNRPKVKPGQLILYDKSGSRIEFRENGTIALIPGNGGQSVIIG